MAILNQLLADTQTRVIFDSALTGRYVLYDAATADEPSSPITQAFLNFVQPTVRIEGLVNKTFAPYGEAKTSHVVGMGILSAVTLGLAAYGAWALYRDYARVNR